MITYGNIKDVNERVNRVELRKGKHYAMVAARVQAFRELIPNGCIETEIVNMTDDMCVIKATISDADGKVLATGHAYERESNGQINRTSFVENCETSAVGRALGMIGIGSEESMASAEEMVQALYQQQELDRPKPDPDMLRAQILGLAKGDIDRVNAFISKCYPDKGYDLDSLNSDQLSSVKVAIAKKVSGQ